MLTKMCSRIEFFFSNSKSIFFKVCSKLNGQRRALELVILYIRKETDGDWVTMGVLYYKAPPKTSSNGNDFSIWKLTDLKVTKLFNFLVALSFFGVIDFFGVCSGTFFYRTDPVSESASKWKALMISI